MKFFNELSPISNSAWRLANNRSVVRIPEVSHEGSVYNAISLPLFELIYVELDTIVVFYDGPVGIKQH